MPRMYELDNGEIVNYPRRNDFIPCTDKGSSNIVLFHPIDIVEFRLTGATREVYEESVYLYTIIVLGVLSTGQPAEIVIDGLPIYFDVLIEDSYAKRQLREILIRTGYFEDKTEELSMFPCCGFQETPSTYSRIYFPNIYCRGKALDKVRDAGFQTATDVRSSQWMNHLIVKYNISIGDWIEFHPRKYKWVDNSDWGGCKHVMYGRIENYHSVSKPMSEEKRDVVTPIQPIYLSLAWDIEVYGHSSEFPTVQETKDDIFQIGGGIYVSNQKDPVLQFCICHKDIEMTGDEEWDWIKCKDEKEVLYAFFNLLTRFRFEFRYAFNNYGFDNPFVITRADQPHIDILENLIDDISPLPWRYYQRRRSDTVFKTIVAMERIKMEGAFDSNAEKFVVKIPGTIDMDIMVYLKRNTYKKDDTLGGSALRTYLDKYKLPNKLDLSFEVMREAYRVNDAKIMKEVADYCVVDGLSCERLARVVSAPTGLMALAHISMTSPYTCMVRAGGGRVTNAIYCQGMRYSVAYTEYPTSKPEFEGKYPGAMVYNPVKGRYIKAPIQAFDFESLYPSIIRAQNMSSETYVEKERAFELRKKGYDVYDFSYELTINSVGTIQTIYFVRDDPEGNQVRGVYPECCKILLVLRNDYKAEMKKARKVGNKVLEELFNEKQKL